MSWFLTAIVLENQKNHPTLDVKTVELGVKNWIGKVKILPPSLSSFVTQLAPCSLDHVGLRKWGLTILGTGAYLTHSCPAPCNRPSPCKPANLLNHACPCIKTL